MKKALCILIAAVLLSGTASAVPARPDSFSYRQPDGSVVRLVRWGDEFAHWTTDVSGRMMELDEDGFYRYSPVTPAQVRRAGMARRASAEGARSRFRGRRSSLTHGTRRIPVILVNFADVSFTLADPVAKFSALLNEEGYSANGGTGSVQDFFRDNSSGEFTPVFDVFGPVTVPNNMSYYGGNRDPGQSGGDRRPEVALYHACQLLDDEVDFSVYDSDGDGEVDMTLFYFAGYNEAEGGPAESIWPHQWSVSYSSDFGAARNQFDGVHVGTYFCSSEYSGGTGHQMCGIGTTSHEFAHSLGLPDFYDTDYATNGSAGGLYSFSLMCSGCYNNSGRTPPRLNYEERRLLGWVSEDAVEIEDGDYVLKGIQFNRACKSSAFEEGEYFLYEHRDGSGWDAFVPSGMLVYHVDKSSNHLVDLGPDYGSATAADLWNNWGAYNYINGNGKHPCFYLVAAQNQSALYFTGSAYAIPFPGSSNVTSYTPIAWDGGDIALKISNIRSNGIETSFHAESQGEKGLEGIVSDLYGNPVAGATVTVDEPGSGAGMPGKRLLPATLGRRTLARAVTDAEGHYLLSLAEASGTRFNVTVTADGFNPASAVVQVIRTTVRKDFALRRGSESILANLWKYDPEGSFNYLGLGSTPARLMAAVEFSAEEMAPYVGLRIEKVMFTIGGTEADVHVLVEFGDDRVLYRKVAYPYFNMESCVDVSDAGLFVPEGKPVRFGYAIENGDNGYPMVFQEAKEDHGSLYTDEVSEEFTQWYRLAYGSDDNPHYCDLKIAASLADPASPVSSLAAMGYNSISCGTEGELSVNQPYVFTLRDDSLEKPSSVVWYLDGKKQGSATLTFPETGLHTVQARLGYSDGKTEVIDWEVTVK